MFTRLFVEIGAAGEAKAREALLKLGDAAVRQAQINASSGSHPRGTPTPARPGSGPAIVSGTLRRSIARTTPVRTAGGWELKVGTKPGQVPPYGRTPSSRYGLYLETGLRNGATYPFLGPAVRFVRTTVLPQVFQAVFRPGWPRL
ncbi:hypothetical protein [Kitasatospora aureofaciens]|uniref:hypothetical protein n=1 Tax=Kitasatospora aureofaciens TaxID=1894 RepID=UPI00340979F9